MVRAQSLGVDDMGARELPRKERQLQLVKRFKFGPGVTALL